MSLNTNGWDYGYHINLGKINTDFTTNSTNEINVVNEIVNSNSINILLSPADINNLNNAILLQLQKNETSILIKKIDLYKDLTDNFLTTFKLPNNLNSTDKVLDYLLKWLDAILNHIHLNVKNRESLVAWYNNINSTNYENFQDVDNIALIKNRAKIYLEYSYYSKIYDLQSFALQNYNQFSHRTVNYLHTTTNFIGTEQVDLLNGLIKTLLSALVPVRYIDKAVFFTNDKSVLSTTKNNFIVKLSELSKWQFILKGSGSVSKIKYNPAINVIEITNGTGLEVIQNVLDINSMAITKLNFDVDINLNWLNKANKVSSKIFNESIKLISIKEVLDTTSNNPALFVNNSVNYYVNKLNNAIFKLNTAGDDLDTNNNFATTDNYYRYHHAFSYLNIAAHKAIDKSELKWLFPTTTTYAIQDEATVPPDLNNSVLSICCMINGNQNKNPATADLNAIPFEIDVNTNKPMATSALIIERSLFGEYIVMPKLVGMFQPYELKGPVPLKGQDYSSTKLGTYKRIPLEVQDFDKSISNTFRYNTDEIKDKLLKFNKFKSLKLEGRKKLPYRKLRSLSDEDAIKLTQVEFDKIVYDDLLLEDFKGLPSEEIKKFPFYKVRTLTKEDIDKLTSSNYMVDLNQNLLFSGLVLDKQDYAGVYSWYPFFSQDTETSFNGKLSEVNVRIEENLVRVNLPSVTYDVGTENHEANNLGIIQNQKVNAYQEYETFFSFEEGKLKTSTQNKMFTLKMEYKNGWLANALTKGGLQFLSTVLKIVTHKKVNTSYIKRIDFNEPARINQIAPAVNDIPDVIRQELELQQSPRVSLSPLSNRKGDRNQSEKPDDDNSYLKLNLEELDSEEHIDEHFESQKEDSNDIKSKNYNINSKTIKSPEIGWQLSSDNNKITKNLPQIEIVDIPVKKSLKSDEPESNFKSGFDNDYKTLKLYRNQLLENIKPGKEVNPEGPEFNKAIENFYDNFKKLYDLTNNNFMRNYYKELIDTKGKNSLSNSTKFKGNYFNDKKNLEEYVLITLKKNYSDIKTTCTNHKIDIIDKKDWIVNICYEKYINIFN